MLSQPSHALLLVLVLTSRAVAAVEQRDVHDCHGVFHVGGDSTSVCCVGGTLQAPIQSTCKGWPICTGSATTTVSPSPLSCATVVTYAVNGEIQSDYSSLVSEANASLMKSGTHIRTTFGVYSTVAGSSASAAASATAGNMASSRPVFTGTSGIAISLGLVAAAVFGLAIGI